MDNSAALFQLYTTLQKEGSDFWPSKTSHNLSVFVCHRFNPLSYDPKSPQGPNLLGNEALNTRSSAINTSILEMLKKYFYLLKREPVQMKPTQPLLYCYYKQFLQSLEWPVTFLFGWHVWKLHCSFIFTTQNQLLCLTKANWHVSTNWTAWFLNPAPIQNSPRRKGLLVLTASFRLWD